METNLWKVCFKGGLLLISFHVSSIVFFSYVPFLFVIHLLEEKLWIPLKEDQLFKGGQMKKNIWPMPKNSSNFNFMEILFFVLVNWKFIFLH